MNSAAVDTVITGARYVLTCDDTGSVHERAGIAVRDGRIVAVGDVDSFDAHRRIDATDCLVLPGLINLHTHLPMTLLRGVAENVDLQGFLERVWAEEARIMGPAGTYLGVAGRRRTRPPAAAAATPPGAPPGAAAR